MESKRDKFRLGLHGLYVPYYDALCAELSQDFQPYCGLRGADEQAKDKVAGVSLAGPWESPHNFGFATDWCLWDGPTPIWPPKGHPKWQPYVDACVKVSLQPGALFHLITDFPHNEYKIAVPWTKVREVYESQGLDSALQFIQQMHTS